MTPAINALKKAKIPFVMHQFDSAAEVKNFGDEAALKLGVAPQQMFKTLLACDETQPKVLNVALVSVVSHLDLKRLAKHLGHKKMMMADPMIAQKVTGYIKGGISPIGQKKQLPTVIDSMALEYDEIYVSGGRRGLSLQINRDDLIQFLTMDVADIAVPRPEHLGTTPDNSLM